MRALKQLIDKEDGRESALIGLAVLLVGILWIIAAVAVMGDPLSKTSETRAQISDALFSLSIVSAFVGVIAFAAYVIAAIRNLVRKN